MEEGYKPYMVCGNLVACLEEHRWFKDTCGFDNVLERARIPNRVLGIGR